MGFSYFMRIVFRRTEDGYIRNVESAVPADWCAASYIKNHAKQEDRQNKKSNISLSKFQIK